MRKTDVAKFGMTFHIGRRMARPNPLRRTLISEALDGVEFTHRTRSDAATAAADAFGVLFGSFSSHSASHSASHSEISSRHQYAVCVCNLRAASQ